MKSFGINICKSIAFAVLIACYGCGGTNTVKEEQTTSTLTLEQAPYDTLPSGEAITSYSLKNAAGMEVRIINFGAIITHIFAPDRTGKVENITLGFEGIEGYAAANPFFGAVVGRYGNRIAKGKFSIDGQEYTLAANDGANHLHGGIKGFNHVVWNAKPIETDSTVGVELQYLSADMEEGYPGNLNTKVTYTLNNSNELRVTYEATTDKPTVVNLTQHAYFNLTGAKRDILSHRLRLNAARYVPVDETLIPEGELAVVEGTPFDFSDFFEIGARIDEEHVQITRGKGYDHCWVLDKPDSTGISLAATVFEPESGRQVDVYTTEPGIQFYSGNFLDGSIVGQDGITYKHRWGLCLETEHFPDSPNQPSYPSTRLNPGETYKTMTTFRFSTRSEM